MAALLLATFLAFCVAQSKMKPEDTEIYTPVPPIVQPGEKFGDPPSDAIILFNGGDLDQWVSAGDTTQPAGWLVSDGILTVNKKTGNIQTKKSFLDYQLHLEFRVPENITGEGQLRGNSGLFLASEGKGDAGYEIQIMDSYKNDTYVNGQAGSIYKQYPPLVNPARPPGKWQTYDVVWTAPRFNEDGSLKTPAYLTAFFNGVLIQNHEALKGTTKYIGLPEYHAHGPSPIKIQAHDDPSEPISFRNIWVREL